MPAIILSDNGATSGSAGLKTSGGNDGVLQLQTTTSGGTPTTAISISNTQVVTYTNQPTYTGGTANGVLYLNGSKAVTSGTALVFDGTNLGVGITSPTAQIHVYKNAASAAQITLENASSSAGSYGTVQFNAGTVTSQLFSDAAGGVYAAGAVLRTTSNHPLIFGTNSSERMRLDSSGNWVLGGTTARTRLTLQAGEANAPTLGTASGGAFFGNSNVAYGTLFGTSGSGYGWIQQQRVDGTGTAYDLCLQPSGGSLLVGTITAVEKITVTAGSIRTTSDNSCIVNGNDANIGFVKKGGYDGHLTVNSSSPMIFSRLNQTTITSATVASGTISEFARFDTSGNLLIGTTNAGDTVGDGVKIYPSYAGVPSIRFVGNSTASNVYPFMVRASSNNSWRTYIDYAGNIYSVNTSITALSDVRLKENIRDLETGLDIIAALKPRRFDWKEGKGQDKKDVAGFIAQEVETVFPEMVSESLDEDENGGKYKTVAPGMLIPTLVKAIQELKAEIDVLKGQT